MIRLIYVLRFDLFAMLLLQQQLKFEHELDRQELESLLIED
jgi:hypothetical protein